MPAARVHERVPARAVEALVSWLPTSEFATSLREVATSCIEIGEDRAAPEALAVVVDDRPTLSGARFLVACAAADADEVAADGVVAAIAAAVADLAGAVDHLEVVGPAVLAHPVAAAVAERWGGTVDLVLGERLLVATEVIAPAVPGAARRAGPADRDLLAAWITAFAEEALGAAPETAASWAEAVDNPSWDLWVWEVDGAPVSMANHRRTTPVSSRVAPVYTPPEHRGHGYAAAVTAAVTQHLLDGGDPRVALFTDETNATSNGVYTRIGYRDIGAAGGWEVRRC